MNQQGMNTQCPYKIGLKLTLFDDRFSSDVVYRKHGVKNVTRGADTKLILAGNALEMIVKPPNWLKRLPPLIVVQVSKQYILLHGFGQGSHALVVFWDDLG